MTDTSDEPVAVILAGGQGSRLWPISRDRRPKQFQPVVRDRPLLTGTIERLSKLVDPNRIHVSTRARFADAARATPRTGAAGEPDPRGGPGRVRRRPSRSASPRCTTSTATLLRSSPRRTTSSTRRRPSTRPRATCSSSSPRRPSRWSCWEREPTRYDPSLGYIHTKGGDDAVRGHRLASTRSPTRRWSTSSRDEGSLYWNTACYGVRVGKALRRLPDRAAADLRLDRALRPCRAVRAGLSRRCHRRPRALPAASGRDGVPGGAAPARLDRHRHLDPARARASDQHVTVACGPALQLESETSWSRAWTVARSSRSARRA